MSAVPNETSVERWQLTIVEKVVGFALLGVLGWMAVTVQQTAVAVARIEERTDILADPAERWTNSEHNLYAQEVDRRFNEIGRRVVELEGGR